MLWNKETKYPNIFVDGKCVYSILNCDNGKRYVGMTEDLSSRMRYHYYTLKKGNHPNNLMQEDFNKGDSFKVEILCRFQESDTNQRKEKALETFFIFKHKAVENGYNKSYNYNNEKSARSAVAKYSEYICRELMA